MTILYKEGINNVRRGHSGNFAILLNGWMKFLKTNREIKYWYKVLIGLTRLNIHGLNNRGLCRFMDGKRMQTSLSESIFSQAPLPLWPLNIFKNGTTTKLYTHRYLSNLIHVFKAHNVTCELLFTFYNLFSKYFISLCNSFYR